MNWLASLTVNEQVSALFIALFGALLLVTGAAVLWSVRDHDDAHQVDHATRRAHRPTTGSRAWGCAAPRNATRTSCPVA